MNQTPHAPSAPAGPDPIVAASCDPQLLRELRGDLWELAAAASGWVVVTTNGTVNARGDLVMGAGLAGQATALHPNLPKLLGEHVTHHGNVPAVIPDLKLATWPTKPGSHTLDNGSTHPGWMCATRVRGEQCHRQVARTTWVNGPLLLASLDTANVTGPVFTARPGCGLGGLDWAKVRPWMQDLLTGRHGQFTVVAPT